MKNILMISTGGTIASTITKKGLDPQLSSEELLGSLSGLSHICNVDPVQPVQI